MPLLFVVENNGIAQTTKTAETVAGSILARGDAFGLPTWRLDDSHPDFRRTSKPLSNRCDDASPGFLVIDTMRLGPHSKGDDLRDLEEMALIRARDPLSRLGDRLESRDSCGD